VNFIDNSNHWKPQKTHIGFAFFAKTKHRQAQCHHATPVR
jgi:hypothetical protein